MAEGEGGGAPEGAEEVVTLEKLFRCVCLFAVALCGGVQWVVWRSAVGCLEGGSGVCGGWQRFVWMFVWRAAVVCGHWALTGGNIDARIDTRQCSSLPPSYTKHRHPPHKSVGVFGWLLTARDGSACVPSIQDGRCRRQWEA